MKTSSTTSRLIIATSMLLGFAAAHAAGRSEATGERDAFGRADVAASATRDQSHGGTSDILAINAADTNSQVALLSADTSTVESVATAGIVPPVIVDDGHGHGHDRGRR